jgi:cation/acetate symporter
MIGTAAMPHLLMRCYTVPSVREARRSVAWALLFVVLLYLMAPALAVFVKHEVFEHLVGLPIDQLPGWIRRWSLLDRSLVSVEDVNGDGILQFGELRLGGEMIVLAAPEIGGLPGVVTYLVAAGGLAAALSTADGLLLTLSNALSHDTYYRVFNPSIGVGRRVMLAKFTVLVVALAAAYVASMRVADILPFVAAAFSIAAAGLFPALVMGIFWRRANAAGAVAGMLAGTGLCLFYMATGFTRTRELLGLAGPALRARWFDIDPVAAGVFGLPAGMAVLVLVSLATAPPPATSQALVDRLREPQSGTG